MMSGKPVAAEDLKTATEEYYKGYDARKGLGRNDLLRNPQVLLQFFAGEAALIHALRFIQANPDSARVLDAGCGKGASLMSLVRLGFAAANLHGVDIRPDQVAFARRCLPASNIECGDASRLEFADNTFDIVHAASMFLQVPDDALAGPIAAEMVRVTKPAGYILISDWRYAKRGAAEFKAVTKKRIARLFSVGDRTVVKRTFPGPLVPPVGRFFSRNLPSLYFLVGAIFPFLRGRMTTVLQKIR
jgi:ubiquinone/menaquinone biosynthesis C-methylase UbiE